MAALAEFAVGPDRSSPERFQRSEAGPQPAGEDASTNDTGQRAWPTSGSVEAIRLLLVGCDLDFGQQMRSRLAGTQWSLREARTGAAALQMLWESGGDVMLLSSSLPDLEMGEFQNLAKAQCPGIQIVSLNPAGAQPGAERRAPDGLTQGLQNFLQPGVTFPATTTPELRPSPQPRIEAGGWGRGWQGIIGACPAMQQVYRAARLVARRSTTVLIQGESGTGKDLLAHAIHNASPREKQPFVVINCAAIPETLLEAELFGYTKGAFTGASQSRLGRVHAAHGGTLFLDEIGDMPLPLQGKILRFLEQGEVQRIGGNDTVKVDCRVIAATNVDLKKTAEAKLFREDLFYRLAVFPIHLPPLRERMDDIDGLSANFLERFCPGIGLHPEARQALLDYGWPGNIRELRNVIERASLFVESRNEILREDIVL